MKKLPLFGLLLAAALIGLSSCTMVARPLEGTWTVDSTEVVSGARVLGDGTITLNYLGEPLPGWEVYTGSGTFSGIFDYIVEVLYIEGFGLSIEMYEDDGLDDPDFDNIVLDDASYAGGGSMSGSYSGMGEYDTIGTKDIGTGNFTATKN